MSLVGVGLSACSALMMTAKDVVSKKVSVSVTPRTNTFASFAYALPYYAVLLAGLYALGFESFLVTEGFILFVFLRALSDIFAEGFKMKAFSLTDMSVVASLLALGPVFLLPLSSVIAQDRISWQGGLGVCCIVIANIVVLRSRTMSHSPTHRQGVLFGIGGAFFLALNTCFDRLAVHTASPTVSAASMTLLSALLLAPLILPHTMLRREAFGSYRFFLLRGFLELLFMVGKLSALLFLPAAYVAALLRIGVIFSVIAGRFYLGEKDFLRRIVAALLTVSGAVVIALAP